MSKLMNLLRRNPRMTMAGIVLVIILVAVVIWMVTRGEDKAAGPKPTIMFTSGSKVLNPAQKDTTETYVEYAAGPGTAGARTAEYIDLEVKWKNGAGFTDKVTALKFVRSKGDTSGTTITHADINTKYVTDASMLKDFASGSLTFFGSEIPTTKGVDDIIGNNYIRVWYTTDAITDPANLSGLKWEPESGSLSVTSPISITITDIDTTYNISRTNFVTIDLAVSGSNFTGEKTVGKKTYYSIRTFDGIEIKKVRIATSTNGVTFLDETDNIYNFGMATTSAINFMFEDYMKNKLLSYLDGNTRKYLQYDKGTGNISFVEKSEIFTDQDTLNKSLLNVVELTFTLWGNYGDDNKYYFNTLPLQSNWNNDGITQGTWLKNPKNVDQCVDLCNKNDDCAMFGYENPATGDSFCYFKTAKLRNVANTSDLSERTLIKPANVSVYQKNSTFQYMGQSNGATNPLYAGQTILPVRFIRFQHVNKDGGTKHGVDNLHIGEVYVYDTNGNKINIEQGNIYASHNFATTPGGAWDITKIVDGKDSIAGIVGSNSGDDRFRWFEIDLGKEHQISGVAFVDRDGYTNNNKKMQIMMTNANGTILEITPPISDSLAWNSKKIFHKYSIATKKWTDSEIDGFPYYAR